MKPKVTGSKNYPSAVMAKKNVQETNILLTSTISCSIWSLKKRQQTHIKKYVKKLETREQQLMIEQVKV